MACRCDIPEPDQRQLESIRVAKHLFYVLKALNEPIDKGIIDTAKSDFGNVGLLDAHTARLCSAIGRMSKRQLNTIVYDGRNADARLLADWWERHQATDKSRRQAEEALAKKMALAEKAKGKLSAKEYEALCFMIRNSK